MQKIITSCFICVFLICCACAQKNKNAIVKKSVAERVAIIAINKYVILADGTEIIFNPQDLYSAKIKALKEGDTVYYEAKDKQFPKIVRVEYPKKSSNKIN